jgi:chromosome segregation ATPase
MATIRLVPSIQQSIVADFLLGTSSSTLTSKHKITMQKIYAILQNHFRSVTISRTQQSPLAGAYGIGIDDLASVNLTRVLHDLRDEIRAKDKQICSYQHIIHEVERSVREFTFIIREKSQDIRESDEKLSQAEHTIVEMMEQQLELNVRREREISELTIAIEGLEQETPKQKADIAVLESQLQRPFTAPDHRLLKEINIPPN